MGTKSLVGRASVESDQEDQAGILHESGVLHLGKVCFQIRQISDTNGRCDVVHVHLEAVLLTRVALRVGVFSLAHRRLTRSIPRL